MWLLVGRDVVVTLKPGTHHLLRPLYCFGGADRRVRLTRIWYRAPAARPLPAGCSKQGATVSRGVPCSVKLSQKQARAGQATVSRRRACRPLVWQAPRR